MEKLLKAAAIAGSLIPDWLRREEASRPSAQTDGCVRRNQNRAACTVDETDGPMTRTFQQGDSPAAPSASLMTFSDFCCSSVSSQSPSCQRRRMATRQRTDIPAGPKRTEDTDCFQRGRRFTFERRSRSQIYWKEVKTFRRLNMQMVDFLISNSAKQKSRGCANSTVSVEKKHNPSVRSRSALQTQRQPVENDRGNLKLVHFPTSHRCGNGGETVARLHTQVVKVKLCQEGISSLGLAAPPLVRLSSLF